MIEQRTVLIIDDEPDLIEVIQYELKARGMRVVSAHNGLEGLERLKTLNPDLIILDLNMPKMGGIEFYQKIVDKDNKPKFPVLILTARTAMEDLFSKMNIDGFITKPFEIEHILAEVNTIIQSRKDGHFRHQEGLSLARKVCIIENDPQIAHPLAMKLLDKGFAVSLAKKGIAGIERIADEVPDIALIKIPLEDMQGDVVALKIKHMAKLKDIKIILYRPDCSHDINIERQLVEKFKDVIIVESSDSDDLMTAVLKR